MNKDDIRALKSKHRIELVMQDAGEIFKKDAENSELWHSTITPGLSVNIRRQMYEIKRPGMDDEAGDVLAWLQRRYTWKFGMALKFLQNRQADPKQPEQTSSEKEGKLPTAVKGKNQPLDQWQEKALEIAGEQIRQYFSWDWYDLVLYIDEIRINPTHAPGTAICTRCGNRIDWQIDKVMVRIPEGYRLEHIGAIPIIAYSIKRRIKVSDLGLSPELEKASEGLIEQIGELFSEEEDGVVCAKCAWREYDFQIALELCKRSAHKREEVEDQDQKKRDHEAWLQSEHERELEEERLNMEAAFLSRTIGEK